MCRMALCTGQNLAEALQAQSLIGFIRRHLGCQTIEHSTCSAAGSLARHDNPQQIYRPKPVPAWWAIQESCEYPPSAVRRRQALQPREVALRAMAAPQLIRVTPVSTGGWCRSRHNPLEQILPPKFQSRIGYATAAEHYALQAPVRLGQKHNRNAEGRKT